MDTSDVIALCAAAASVVISVGALLLSRYLGHRSVDEATRAADAAERSADAAEQANEFVQQASRKGIRAPDATTAEARQVGWQVERGSRPNILRLRNVGEAAAVNVSVEPHPWLGLVLDDAAAAGLGGPTIQPNEAVDLAVVTVAERAPDTYALVSWDGVRTPVAVPIPLD